MAVSNGPRISNKNTKTTKSMCVTRFLIITFIQDLENEAAGTA